MNDKRTPAKKKAKELAKFLRTERPDYNYLKSVFHHLREELDIMVTKASKKLPDVPIEKEIERYYKAVWKSQNFQDMVIIKTFLYTGIRVSELIGIHLEDVNYDRCQIRINAGKGGKDRIVPFPSSFKEVLAMHADRMRQDRAEYLFESSWKRKYTDRGIRKLLTKYAKEAGIKRKISPHRLRHFLLTWLNPTTIPIN
ncbi:MAG: tyrosine-type recombinase/integrase [Planctomycetes bacterium]|nr:tyrosine-type recombinase/integrase [Planctomycetota bacterium]